MKRFVLLPLLLLVLTGCYLDRSWGPVHMHFTAAPSYVCPGEVVHLKWDVDTEAGCTTGRPSPGAPRCSSVQRVYSDPATIDLANPPNPGEADQVVTEFTTFSALSQYCDPSDRCTEVIEMERQVQIVQAAVNMPFNFQGTCDGWADLRLDLSPCVEASEICVPFIASGDVITITPIDSDGNAGTPIHLEATNNCASAASLRNASRLRATRTSLSPSTLRCGGGVQPDQVHPLIATYIVMDCNSSLPGCTLGGGTPTPTLPPGAGGGGSDDMPTPTAPPPDPCADHGGTQYSGSTCVCPGIVDNVVICADGFKIDSPTTDQCTPAETCGNPPSDGGGTSGGDQCQNSVCGDGKCDYPACENSITCPADCFG